MGQEQWDWSQMNKDTASRQGSAVGPTPRGSGGEAREGDCLHLHWAAQKLINRFLMKCCSVHLSVHAGPSSVDLLSVPRTHAAFLAPLALRSVAGRSDDTSSSDWACSAYLTNLPNPRVLLLAKAPGLPRPWHPLGREGPKFPFVHTRLR